MTSNADQNQPTLHGIPLFPLRYGVILPGGSIQVPVGRSATVQRLKKLSPGDTIIVATQVDPAQDRPDFDGLYPLGTRATLVRIIRANGHHVVEIEPTQRVELESLTWHGIDALVDAHLIETIDEDATEAVALKDGLIDRINGSEKFSSGFVRQLDSFSAGLVGDVVARELSIGADERYEILEATSAIERLRLVHEHLTNVETYDDVRRELDKSLRKDARQAQKEAVLRQQLKAIKNELGDNDDERVEGIRERIEALDLPDEVQSVVDRELRKLETTPEGQAEHGVILRYLEVIAELPWNERAEEPIEIPIVEQKLDDDHYGLDEVKDRILEHLAVMESVGNSDATVLCLVGPPGVGKTSIATSIADAIDRPFIRIALGGVRDEAEIRGHRRTYIGALPGRIINGFRKSKVTNPVVLLDEIDKLGKGWSGDPEAALLEVLDPEQNDSFTDHYLEVPYDLSDAIFICTANTLDTLSAPLRDRMEIISLDGYTSREKTEIAKQHLIPTAASKHKIEVVIEDSAIEAILAGYTRESGVRQLDRQIRKLFRALTLQRAKGALEVDPIINAERVRDLLGRAKFLPQEKEAVFIPGVAAGLAWTPVGGDVLYVETTRMPGKGSIQTTGQLGDVMKESARAAMSYVRSHSEELEVDPTFLETSDIHVHFPAGAVPKDGPSAGVTVFTALTSLLTGRAVRPDTAMTGECSLRGRVLPVGGIKTKVLAAHRLGYSRVVLPKQNALDLDELPEQVRDEMEFILASTMDEVLDAALEKDPFVPLDNAGPSALNI